MADDDIESSIDSIAATLGLERLQALDPVLFRNAFERVQRAAPPPVSPTTEPAHIFVALRR
jgi:hypothetical protein